MRYRRQIEKSALKQLGKLEKNVREKIRAKVDELADDPRPHSYKKLVDEGGTCRVKVSIYRILYGIFDKVLIINIITIIKRNGRTNLLNREKAGNHFRLFLFISLHKVNFDFSFS